MQYLSLEEIHDDGTVSGQMIVPCLPRYLVVRTTITILQFLIRLLFHSI